MQLRMQWSHVDMRIVLDFCFQSYFRNIGSEDFNRRKWDGKSIGMLPRKFQFARFVRDINDPFYRSLPRFFCHVRDLCQVHRKPQVFLFDRDKVDAAQLPLPRYCSRFRWTISTMCFRATKVYSNISRSKNWRYHRPIYIRMNFESTED